MAYCSKCGTQLSDGDKFCPKCGTPSSNNFSHSSIDDDRFVKQKKSHKALAAVIVAIAIIGGAWFLWSRLSTPKYSLESLAKIVSDYDYVENFHDGIAIGNKGDKHGYFNMQGEVITPCIYEEAASFTEGLARVKKDGKWGFINNTGEEIIPCQYNDAHDFSEGLALVEKDDKCGFIDNEGKTVIPFIYGGNSYSFSEGLAAVSTDHGYQYIDKTGKIVLNCSWDNGAYWNFHNGLAPRMDDEGENYGFIDKTGKMVIPASFYPYKYDIGEFKDGFAIVTRAGNIEKGEVIDVNGRNVLEFDFDGYAEYNDGVILIHSDDEVTFYNTKGEKIIEKKYKNAKPFSEGLAPVTDGEYWGYIDKTGKMIIPATFEMAGEFSEGLAVIKKNGLYGYIDKEGNCTIDLHSDKNNNAVENSETEGASAILNDLNPEQVFALMNNIMSTALANQCGLEEIFKYDYYVEGDEDDPGVSIDIEIYGKEVKKGTVSNNGDWVDVEILPCSDHSCYLRHVCNSDCGYSLAFINKEDATNFLNKVIDSGVYKISGTYIIPKKKQFKGIRESDYVDYEDIAYNMSEVQYSDGWYVISLW